MGVNSDDNRDEVKKVIGSEKMTWRNWWDGGTTEGPIASRWNVSGWPTIYVLDAKGIIRYRSVSGVKLDEAVDALLKESAPPKP